MGELHNNTDTRDINLVPRFTARIPHHSGMYRAIVEDNIGYFVCASLLALVDLCLFRFDKGSQAAAKFASFHTALQSITCARLFLKLRSAAYKQMESVASLSTWRAHSGARTAAAAEASDVSASDDLNAAAVQSGIGRNRQSR